MVDSAKRNLLRTIGAGGAIGMAGCISGGDGTASSDNVDLDSATIGHLSGIYLSRAFFYPLFAEQLEERGIDFGVEFFNDYTPAVGALLKDQIQMPYMSVQAVAGAINENLPVRGLAGYSNSFFFHLVSDPEITSFDELEGGTVALHTPSSASTAVAQRMVQEELGSPDAVEYTFIQRATNRIAAIDAGEVDAGTAFPAAGFSGADEGTVNVLSGSWEYDSLNGSVSNVWVTLDGKLDDSSQEGVIKEALTESYERVYEEDAGTIVDKGLATDYFPGLGRKYWMEAFEGARDGEIWPRDGEINPDGVEDTLDLLIETGLIDEELRFDVDEFIADI